MEKCPKCGGKLIKMDSNGKTYKCRDCYTIVNGEVVDKEADNREADNTEVVTCPVCNGKLEQKNQTDKWISFNCNNCEADILIGEVLHKCPKCGEKENFGIVTHNNVIILCAHCGEELYKKKVKKKVVSCPACGGELYEIGIDQYKCKVCGAGIGVDGKYVDPSPIPSNAISASMWLLIFLFMLIILIGYFLITYFFLNCFNLIIFIILLVITIFSMLKLGDYSGRIKFY